MNIKALAAALSPLQIKRNSAFLDRQGRNSLRAFYITGVLIRAWVLYLYAQAVSGAVVGFLEGAGWSEAFSLFGGYSIAALVSLLALLALRNWLAGISFVVIFSLIGAALVLSVFSSVNVMLFKQFAFSILFSQLLYLSPLMLLQFSMFERSALKSRVRATSHSYADDEDDDVNESMEMMKGESFYDMRTSNY